MKRTTALLAAALLSAPLLFAEDKAPGKVPAPAAAEPAPDNTPPPLAPAVDKDKDRLELMPSKPAQLLPPPAGLSLIPDIPLPPEKTRPRLPESPIKKRDATADAEDLVKQRIRLREAKTKAQRDPAIMAEWDRAAGVKTDYEKREVLRGYYKLLYGRMAKLDPTLKAVTDRQLQEALGQLEQNKIAPTQPPATVADGLRAKR